MKRKLCKSITCLLGMALILGIFPIEVNAANIEKSPIIYDMEKGGTQKFQSNDKYGNEIYVEISEVKSRVANNTYQINYTSTGCWRAGFKVKVKNNAFISAYDPYCNVIMGRVTNGNLRLNSSKKASYTFNYFPTAISFYTGVQASISGTKLNVEDI